MPGVGLGLSVVRELIAEFGGTVGVSRVNGETRVWFSIPHAVASRWTRSNRRRAGCQFPILS